ncbi:MAG: 3-isopropylmalate dehydratase [Alphaproteobacteria bacterium]|nr:3-isopropylmalate dehydratase [Alphaproteobacteria bacterium]
MGYTISEKILGRASTAGAPMRAGSAIEVKPDFVLGYDFPGYLDVMFRQLREELGCERVVEPERFGIFIDHMVPATTPAEEDFHAITRSWCRANHVRLHEREGIGHQVAAEAGYAVPGAFVVHFDGHVSQLGAFGTLAIGIHQQLLEAFARERITFTVPHTTRVNLRGRLQRGVMARDVFHHLVRVLGPRSCRFQVLELGGQALPTLSLEGRQTITGLAMFTGALSSICNPDQDALDYALPRALKQLEPVSSDEDANFAAVHDIDLSGLAPIVVVPPSPAATADLVDYLGLPVQAGYLGSCASGRLEDLRAAVLVLSGRKVSPGFALHVVPTSRAIMAQAAAEGLLTPLIEAGAFISSSSCDYCYGRIATMSAGQRAVSTGTLNVRGRMGSPDSEIYLCNAAAVAASAIEGRIADPRHYLP